MPINRLRLRHGSTGRRVAGTLGSLLVAGAVVCARAEDPPATRNVTPGPALAPLRAGGDVFLQGRFVELGIHNAFSFGSAGPQPAGFHGNQSALGFIADIGRDGWMVGMPRFAGDYFMPGDPEEGWGVEWTNTAGVEITRNNFGRMNLQQVPTTSLINTSTPGLPSATWEGTAVHGEDRLHLLQRASIDPEGLYILVNVTLTNAGPTSLRSVEYFRNVDPDQEQPWTSNFTTSNWVESQPPRPAAGSRLALPARPAENLSRALAIAQGLKYGLTLGLGTMDPRAVVTAGQGFSSRDTDLILDNPLQPSAAAPDVSDSAIALAYELGTLAPGQSVTFDYAYILNTADLDTVLGQLAEVQILQPRGTVSGANVIFQAKTNDPATTQSLEFYAHGALLGMDTTPDATGAFSITFDSRPYPNGSLPIKAVARFTGGNVGQKIATVTVENAGPPMGFVMPLENAPFTGADIPVEIGSLDPAHPPVRVSFFREASNGSLFLGEDLEAPFTASFSVEDLAPGEPVILRAVGTDAFGKMTAIQVAGNVLVNRPPVAQAGPDQTLECTGSVTTLTLDGSGSTDPDRDALTYEWTGPFGTLGGAQITVALPVGSHPILLKVQDPSGATSTDSVQVNVVDTVPPLVEAGPDVRLEATSAAGAPYRIDPVVSDLSGTATVNQTPDLTVFPLGSTLVTIRATDASGNAATDEVSVTVLDTTAPLLVLPADLTVECTEASASSPALQTFLRAARATDLVDPAPQITHDAPAIFPMGITPVTFTARDAFGNGVQGQARVTVLDRVGPKLSAALVRLGGERGGAGDADGLRFQVVITSSDACDASVDPASAKADLNGIPVKNGQVVSLELEDEAEVEYEDGILCLSARQFTLTVTAKDHAGNQTTVKVVPVLPCEDSAAFGALKR